MLAVVNPHTIHSCNPIINRANIYYMMYLKEEWCRGIQQSISQDIKNFKVFPKDIIQDDNLYDEFKILCEILMSEITYLEKEDILIEFFSKFFGQNLEDSEEQTEDKVFEDIKQYLNDNFQQNISLTDLSNIFNLNSFYIIRLFKTNLNITPHAYLINIKINKAKELLKAKYSIVDTALECGFVDQSHMHRNFLKLVASTPKEYEQNFA